MFETITSTENSVSSFINITSTLASTTALVFDYNTTELWNAIDGGGDETNGSDLYDACHPANPDFNCSVEDYLSYSLGAKQMPLETAIWVSFLEFTIKSALRDMKKFHRKLMKTRRNNSNAIFKPLINGIFRRNISKFSKLNFKDFNWFSRQLSLVNFNEI